MKIWPISFKCICCLVLLPLASGKEPSTVAADDGSGLSFFTEPFVHIHASALGTPVVHSFNVEPALTGRDLFLSYRYRRGDGYREQEIETELEWAFTKRLGVIFELPYIFERENGGRWEDGIGDLAVVPRAMLVERERLMLTAQVEVIAPTGTGGFGGETALAPGIAAWLDLGNWWTLNSQFAIEHNFDENANEFVFGLGLVKSIGGRGERCDDGGHGGHDHDHYGYSGGGLHFHAEATGTVGLSGQESGVTEIEGLVGVSYGIREYVDIRIGYEFPLTSPRAFDGGVVAGLIIHF